MNASLAVTIDSHTYDLNAALGVGAGTKFCTFVFNDDVQMVASDDAGVAVETTTVTLPAGVYSWIPGGRYLAVKAAGSLNIAAWISQ